MPAALARAARYLSLTEDGGGLLILSGTNSYSGGTTVDAGTLLVTDDPALPAGGELDSRGGGTLIFDPSAVAAADNPLGRLADHCCAGTGHAGAPRRRHRRLL